MLRTIDTSQPFKDKLIHIESNVTHSHGPGGDHSHGGTAFTTWLDFSQAAQQAEVIYKAFSPKLPAQKKDFVRNLEAMQKDLLDLDARMIELSAKRPGLPLVASHPIYQYMARRYKLNLKMVM
jgi:zinc transport system substrate-binding protein